jgi:hypothetical protein
MRSQNLKMNLERKNIIEAGAASSKKDFTNFNF